MSTRKARLVTQVESFRREAEQTRKRAELVHSLLADVGAIQVESYGNQELLDRLTRVAVPRFADWCQFFVDGGDGLAPRLACAHVDPAAELVARDMLERYPRPASAELPSVRAVSEGEPMLIRRITEDYLGQVACDADHLDLLHRLKPGAAIVVPLQGRKRTFGAITFVRGRSRVAFVRDDIPSAQEFSRRVALVLDNARLDQAARAAVHLRDEFLSVAAHELKTPVTALRLLAQVSLYRIERGGEYSTEQLERTLREVEQQSGRLARLVNELLDVARLETGRLALAPTTTDLTQLARAAIASLEPHSTAERVVLGRDEPLLARVDPLRLEQVIANLLDNALRYGGDGEPVEVELHPDGPDAVVAVVDHGPGIPFTAREGLFERFYPARDRNHTSGLGLGLFISRQIVELHCGTLQATFPPDGGSRFTIRVPLTQSAS
jgi:signal transduction histidine kinase